MVMSCVLRSSFVATTIFIIPRAHTGTTQLGQNFGQSYRGWKEHIEDPFTGYLHKIFSVFPLFFYVLTFVHCHLAREMRQECALPGAKSTQDPSAANDEHNQLHSHINSKSDASQSTGSREKEPDDARIELGDLFKRLKNKTLYTLGDSNSGSEG